MKKDRTTAALDRAIEREYYAQAAGRQIDILKIGALFKTARAMVTAGATVPNAVAACIEQFCEPVTR